MASQSRLMGSADSAAEAISRHRHLSHARGTLSVAGHTIPALTDTSYKTLKEAWIADQTGSSVHRVNLLGLIMLSTYALWAVIRSRRRAYALNGGGQRARKYDQPLTRRLIEAFDQVSNWQLEFVVLIVPAIAAQTILSSHLLALNALIIAVIAVLLKTAYEKTGQTQGGVASLESFQQHWSEKYIAETEEVAGPKSTMSNQARLPIELQTDLPFRVSIDSAADAAHASAAPPTFYDEPQTPLDPTSASTSVLTHGSRDSSQTASDSLSRSQDIGTLNASMLPSSGGSDSQSVISSSSPMSPLARSVVDPWAKAKRSCVEPPPDSTMSSTSQTPFPNSKLDTTLFVRPQPFLTVYRAHMMLVTIIAILAVDFPVFPREFSKCETWGTSWMDMGVGSFVFSLGIISALPFLRSPTNRFTPFKRQLVSDFRKSLPLILLGSIRVIMVKGVEYPEHVTEYGVHWNFFITLAILPFAATLSRPFSRWIRYSLLGLTLSGMHQVLLYHTRWQEWAISSLSRDTLAAQNKEGLTSLPGYLAIFYLGLDLGHYVLPLDPYFAYRKLRSRRLKPKTGKLAMVLGSLSILWWSGYAITRLVGLQTSRRLANLPYVLWVTAFNTSFLLCYVLIYFCILQPIEYAAKPTKAASSEHISNHSQDDIVGNFAQKRPDSVTPSILSDLNRHSLSIFLVANLLTGLVNVSMQTMYTNDWIAFLIVTMYASACCATATYLTSKKLRLRL